MTLSAELIEPLMDPLEFPEFHELVFGDPDYDERCVAIIDECIANRQSAGKPPPYKKREKLTAQLVQVESFRYHHLKQYLLTPIWVHALHSPKVDLSIKRKAAECIVRVTTSFKHLALVGTAAYAGLQMEPETRSIKEDPKILLRDPIRGHLISIIGAVSTLRSMPPTLSDFVIPP